MAAKSRVAALTALVHALRATRRPGAPGIGAHVAAVPRMLALGLTGRYPGLSKTRLVMALLGVLDAVSPVDLMPEILLGVFGLEMTRWWRPGSRAPSSVTTDAFLRWEADRRRARGQVVR